MKHVTTIPPDCSFVDALAAGLWQQAEQNPLKLSEILVLLPTRRAQTHLREAFVRVTGGVATLLPRMQPLGDVDEEEFFFGTETNLNIPPAITPLRRQMLLTQLVVKKDPTLPLDQATQLAASLASLLDQVQIEERDFSQLKELVPAEYAQHWQDTIVFLEIITSLWPKILVEEGCIDPALRRNMVLKAQAEMWRQNPPTFPVIAAGSTGSMPAVAALLAVIAELPHGKVVLPGLDQQLEEAGWQQIEETHPQYGMKQWLEHIGLPRHEVKLWQGVASQEIPRLRLLQEAMRPAGSTDEWRKLTATVIPAESVQGLSRLELEHQQEEADVIALRLRAVLEEKDKKAVLVTFDRNLAARVEAALLRWGIVANDSAGASLASLPVGSFLRETIKAAAPDASAIDYLSLLKHPLAACGVSTAACRQYARQIELDVWRGFRLADGWATVEHVLQTKENKQLTGWVHKIRECFDLITKHWFDKIPLQQHIQQHMALAEKLAATDEESGASRLWRDEDGEGAAEWFDEWQNAARDIPPLTGAEYLRLFTALVRTVSIHPRYGQHSPLNILGPLEARLHHADLVILGALNEGSWPPEAPLDPWMSRPMKHQFRLPLPERRIGLSAHDFVQLAAAPEVILTRSRRVGTAPTVPSRFLLQLDAVLQAVGHSKADKDILAPAEPWVTWVRQMDEASLAEIKPCARPAPVPPLAVRPTSLPVRDISKWQRNPYAIYAEHILKLRKLKDIAMDVSASDRGNIIHKALEKFLTQHKEKWPAEPFRELLSIGREVFATYKDWPQVEAFWWPRFEQIARWFAEEEQQRQRQGIKVLAVECSGTATFAEGKFTLRGRADRIDRLADGSAAIIDYKTGATPSHDEIRYGYESQLPLLALIAETGEFEGLPPLQATVLEHWKLQGSRDGEEIKPVKEVAAHIVAARSSLEKLLVKFADPKTAYEAVPKPRFYKPQYDDYAHLARIAEWGQVEGEA